MKTNMSIEKFKDNLNEEILSFINQKNIQIEFEKIKGNIWESETIFDSSGNIIKFKIKYVDCKYPKASFTHELLHLYIQLKGVKKIRYGISAVAQGEELNALINNIDNELHHHKMFKDFNFPKEQFYNDNDVYSEPHVRSFLAKEEREFKDIFFNYLTLIAPGGYISTTDRDSLKKEFRDIVEGYSDYFDHLDNVFEEWTNSSSYNISVPIIKIFERLEDGTKSFFGYGVKDDFPNNGFFTGEKFHWRQS